jgi:hypothetical protein
MRLNFDDRFRHGHAHALGLDNICADDAAARGDVNILQRVREQLQGNLPARTASSFDRTLCGCRPLRSMWSCGDDGAEAATPSGASGSVFLCRHGGREEGDVA